MVWTIGWSSSSRAIEAEEANCSRCEGCSLFKAAPEGQGRNKSTIRGTQYSFFYMFFIEFKGKFLEWSVCRWIISFCFVPFVRKESGSALVGRNSSSLCICGSVFCSSQVLLNKLVSGTKGIWAQRDNSVALVYIWSILSSVNKRMVHASQWNYCLVFLVHRTGSVCCVILLIWMSLLNMIWEVRLVPLLLILKSLAIFIFRICIFSLFIWPINSNTISFKKLRFK